MTNTKKTLITTFILLLSGHAQAAFEIKEIPKKYIDVRYGGKVVARVMTAYDESTDKTKHETYKVYTHIFDELGKTPITKGAGGAFTHHRGIFLGWSKTRFSGKTVDSWHMKGCVQVYRKIIDSKADEKNASLTMLIQWISSEGIVFIEEQRTQTFRNLSDRGLFLEVDFKTTLKAPHADVELNGDPEHAGCQFRPSNEISKNKSAKYLFHKEGINPKNDKDLPWVAESFMIGDETYFVQHMSHPSIPKGNIYSAYRDYGRFGAYFVSRIAKGESMDLQYKFLIGKGDLLERDFFNAQYKNFAK
jgi:hypothetical protein